MRTTTKSVSHMRLVRDDEPIRNAELEAEEVVLADQFDETEDRDKDSNEQPDGSVSAEDASDDAEDSSATDLPPVNLAAMEALLFSTHHPLTVGRLAELLEL